MRKSTLLVFLYAGLLCAQTSDTLTNDTLVKLVQAGVPIETIIRTIAMLKAKAADIKASGGTNKEVAAVLYDTKYPSDQQRKNVPTILRHYQQKSKQSGSPSNTRKPSARPP